MDCKECQEDSLYICEEKSHSRFTCKLLKRIPLTNVCKSYGKGHMNTKVLVTKEPKTNRHWIEIEQFVNGQCVNSTMITSKPLRQYDYAMTKEDAKKFESDFCLFLKKCSNGYNIAENIKNRTYTPTGNHVEWNGSFMREYKLELYNKPMAEGQTGVVEIKHVSVRF